MNMRRSGAAASALLLAFCMLTGCGESSSETENVAVEDMPYGASMTIDASRAMTFSYDARFLDSALIDRIADYYTAIQEKDGDKLTSLMFPVYHQYQLTEVYDDQVTDQQIVDETYDAMQEYFGFDFEYSFVEITDLLTVQGQSEDYDALEMMLTKLLDQQGSSYSDDVQALYAMYVTRYLDKKGENAKKETDYVLEDELLYAIQYQGQWYLMYS